MRRYELMLLLRPDLEDDKLQAAVEKVTRAIVNGGGSLSKVSPWGKRRLAYDIKRHREASYFLIHFDIEPAEVREIERGMLISEEILRHLVTVLEDRGTTDELAPAAAARSGDDDEALDTDAFQAAVLDSEALDTDDTDALDTDAFDVEAPEPDTDDDVVADDARDDTSADDAVEEPAEVERAAG